jgi:Domain of unknown function DUF11
MLRWSSVIALAFVAAIGLGGAATSGAADSEICTQSGPLVCMTVSDDPAVVSPSSADSPTYVVYTATVTNRAQSTITHVTATATFSDGLVLDSASSSVGSCTTVSGLSCTIGRLARNATATVTAVAKAPQTEGTVIASFRFSFDERFNDSGAPDPKQDTVSEDEKTTIEALSGTAASFVPKGASVTLTTDPTNTGVATTSDPLIGQAIITTSPTATTALIDEVSLTLPCPKKVICRSGDWFHADIPGTFDPPLAFPLRWDRTVIPSSLNAKKFSLLYTACLDGCQLQVISRQCSSATPSTSELPCLTGVAKLADGDWKATLVSDHNGWMK